MLDAAHTHVHAYMPDNKSACLCTYIGIVEKVNFNCCCPVVSKSIQSLHLDHKQFPWLYSQFLQSIYVVVYSG